MAALHVPAMLEWSLQAQTGAANLKFHSQHHQPPGCEHTSRGMVAALDTLTPNTSSSELLSGALSVFEPSMNSAVCSKRSPSNTIKRLPALSRPQT